MKKKFLVFFHAINLAMTVVVSFGTGAFGRLGFPDNRDQMEPRALPISGRDISCVSAGLYHSALVTSDHSVLVFGSNATDCLGEHLSPQIIPSGAYDDEEDLSEIPSEFDSHISRLKSISRRLQIVQAAVGGDLIGAHTLLVSKHGRLYAMGQAKACGISGTSASSTVKVPTLVTEFVRDDLTNPGSELVSLERVSFAAAGGSCSAVITTEGHLYTFGITTSGRLGLDRKSLGHTVQTRPKRVDALLLDTVVTVSVGGSHMLCVTQRGTLFAWGDNCKGQLGLGDLNDRYKPVCIEHPNRSGWAPVIAAGEGHSLAVDVYGKLFSWGGSGGAMLGRGACQDKKERERALCVSFQLKNLNLDFAVPKQIAALSDYRIERVSAGVRHSVAVTIGGLVFIWGSRNQVGIVASCISQCSIPRLLFPVGRVEGLSAGSYHTLILRNGSEFACVPFQRLIDKAALSLPYASADGFVTCENGRKLWINTTAVKSIVSSSAWTAFWKPQISVLTREEGAWGGALDLSTVAEFFKMDNNPSETDHEYDRLEKVIDEWISECTPVEEEDVVSLPKVPSDCLFESLSAETALKFYHMVLTDQLPELPPDGSVECEGLVTQLIKLAICSQLDRPAALLKQRLKRIEKNRFYTRDIIPRPRLVDAVEHLYVKSLNAASAFVPGFVYFHCGPHILRELNTDLVAIHTFVVESWCLDLPIPAGDLRSDASPARKRNGWKIRVEEDGLFHVDSFSVPVDAMKELALFFYLNRFNEAENSVEVDFGFDEKLSVNFWSAVASAALCLGSEAAQAAALDKLVSRMNEKNCLRIASETAKVKKSNQVKEGALSLAEEYFVKKVEESESIQKGYPLSNEEAMIASFVDSVIGAELNVDNMVDPLLAQTVRDRVVKRIAGKLALDQKLKETLEHYQGLNAEIIPELGDSEKGIKSKLALWFRSVSASVRGGPSLVSCGRDLSLAICVAAVLSTMFSASGLVEGNGTAKVVIVTVNVAFVIVAVFLLYKHFGKNQRYI